MMSPNKYPKRQKSTYPPDKSVFSTNEKDTQLPLSFEDFMQHRIHSKEAFIKKLIKLKEGKEDIIYDELENELKMLYPQRISHTK